MSAVTIRMSDSLRKAARIAAAYDDISLNQWVVVAMEEKIARDGPKQTRHLDEKTKIQKDVGNRHF